MREIIGNGYINHYFMIQFKVVQSNGSIRSISHVQISRLNEIRKLYPILLEFWDLKSEEYRLSEILGIIFSYKILPVPPLYFSYYR